MVEDEPMVAKGLKLLLTYKGHQVELAENGERGLKMFETGNYDLVITDYFMPGMDGLELACAIKKRHPQQPIIMVTAHAEMLSKTEAIDVILPKPYSVEQILDALARVFPNG